MNTIKAKIRSETEIPNLPSLLQQGPKPRVGDQSLKNAEVIEVKQKELHERAFTTFCLENWDSDQIDSLAELARKNDNKFVPYNQNATFGRNEEDSYDKSTTYIRRSFVAGSPEDGFKEIKTITHPFGDDGSLMAHPLVNSALSYIYQLLPGEMRPEKDRIEVSLIRQCAFMMPELIFHRDVRQQVFVLMLACNIKENKGGEMSVRDENRVMDGNKIKVFSKTEINISKQMEFDLPVLPVVEDINYHYSHMPSEKGNGYLIRENTQTTADKKQIINHRRGAFSTNMANPERITLRILIDDNSKLVCEAV